MFTVHIRHHACPAPSSVYSLKTDAMRVQSDTTPPQVWLLDRSKKTVCYSPMSVKHGFVAVLSPTRGLCCGWREKATRTTIIEAQQADSPSEVRICYGGLAIQRECAVADQATASRDEPGSTWNNHAHNNAFFYRRVRICLFVFSSASRTFTTRLPWQPFVRAIFYCV